MIRFAPTFYDPALDLPVYCSRCRDVSFIFDAWRRTTLCAYPWLCHKCRKPMREGGVA